MVFILFNFILWIAFAYYARLAHDDRLDFKKVDCFASARNDNMIDSARISDSKFISESNSKNLFLF